MSASDPNLYKGEFGDCSICDAKVVEVCTQGQACKECHVSCSWEDCMDQTWEARQQLKSGRTREEVLVIYPNARI